MPTIFTHPAVPLAMALGLGRGSISRPLLAAGVVASMLPDLDVLAFRLGIPYAAALGHRGFSHSLLFALLLAALGACAARALATTPRRSFAFLFVATASHGVLDAFTNGGLGVALLWPWSEARFFAPVQPIEVAPLSIGRFLSAKGLAVLQSEFLWVWLPLLGAAAFALAWRRCSSTTGRSPAGNIVFAMTVAQETPPKTGNCGWRSPANFPYWPGSSPLAEAACSAPDPAAYPSLTSRWGFAKIASGC